MSVSGGTRRTLALVAVVVALGCAGPSGGSDVGTGDVSGSVDVASSLETDAGPRCEAPPTHAYSTGADRTFRRGPYLQSVMGDAAVIVWMDAVDGGEGCVDYTVEGAEPQTVCVSPDTKGQYEVTLGDLPADVPVTYEARVGERVAGPFTFPSAPAPEQALRLLVFADVHANSEVLGAISQAALQEPVHMAVGVGDLVDVAEDEQWDAFFEGLRPLGHRVGFWPVQGNHERRHASYFHNFVVPEAPPPVSPEFVYAARVGQAWFASLHIDDWIGYAATEGSVDLPGVAYVRAALESDVARSARWRLLFLHQPPWSFGWDSCEGYEGELVLRDYLVPFAAEYGVDAMFFGHMHGYERGTVDGVALVTTGGAGGALDHACPHEGTWPEPWVAVYEHHYTIVEAGCDALTVTARDLAGTVIDQFSVESAR